MLPFCRFPNRTPGAWIGSLTDKHNLKFHKLGSRLLRSLETAFDHSSEACVAALGSAHQYRGEQW
jgi:DNA-directed RNA polymerase specialized sigma24 family protein